MRVSREGVELIQNFEGCRLVAYQDIGGVWTIGYGHTFGVKAGDSITQERANKWLLKDIQLFEQLINNSVKVAITQEMFDALVSFLFNVGDGNFKESTLLKKLNQSDYFGASQEFQ